MQKDGGKTPFSSEFQFRGDPDEVIKRLKEQLDGQSFVKLDEGVFLIPGLNPDFGVLCGTNVFAIGKGKERYLVDACKKDHGLFLDNLKAFMKEENCYIKGVFITHSHYDHMDGA